MISSPLTRKLTHPLSRKLSGGDAGGPSLYLGIVATRGNVPSNIYSIQTLMQRSMHYARDSIMSLKILVPAFYVDANSGTPVEVAAGANTTVTASVEYPASTFTQIKFSGVAAGTVPNGGMLESDFCTVAIPNGAQFWIRMYLTNLAATGVPMCGSNEQGSVSNGDLCSMTDGDKTMSGTVSNGFAGFVAPPCAILGMTTKPSVLLLGSSRVSGLKDTQDSSGDLGITARSIGPSFGYINAGVASGKVVNFVASHTNRVALGAYASHVIAEGPTNDNVSDVSGYQANLQSMWGYYTALGKKVFAVTCNPQTTGAWTLVNQTDQTLLGDFEATVNPYLRGVPAPLSGCFDITTVTATGVRGNRFWNADGTVQKWTLDGTHEKQFANLAIKAVYQSIMAAAITR